MTPRAMRRHYLREAALLLRLSQLAISLLPPSRIFAWVDRPPGRVRRFAADEADWVAWAVEHVARRRGMKAACLVQALAAHAMLRRRGIPSTLCLGVCGSGGSVAAHAWIESQGRRLTGGADAATFTPLTAFGSTA
ncbi:lasso peptide biosynthesis B2 protein [Pseudorhodoplanes sp.]|uniref:lasso peptide biosynthesis B2 protein n=1 Tax=Pseudorhodoplanes sp. TaxID=1934341 RepID=UPI00391A1346